MVEDKRFTIPKNDSVSFQLLHITIDEGNNKELFHITKSFIHRNSWNIHSHGEILFHFSKMEVVTEEVIHTEVTVVDMVVVAFNIFIGLCDGFKISVPGSC